MRPILHVSDPHFGTELPQVADALVALSRKVAPRLVLLSGDITQRARRRQFASARRFTDRLQLPVVAIPGNHDIPLFNLLARCLAPYAGYRRFFGPALEPVLDEDDVLVIGVNSTRPWRHKNGEISANQIAWVDGLLRQARPEQLRVVMLHHPMRALESHDIRNMPSGHETASQAWTQAGADLILGGHIHLPYVLPLAVRDGARHAWAVQAGTAVSRRIRGSVPNSVNLIHHQNTACRIERWDYQHGEFQCAARTELTLSRQ